MIPASRTASATTMPWLRRGIAVASCLLLLTACDWFRTPAPKPDNFPVVVPFPLDKAGNTVRVEFELPPPNANGNLRPVFIGFRTVAPPPEERTAEFDAAHTAARKHLVDSDVPIRLTLMRIEETNQLNIPLQEIHSIPPPDPHQPWQHEYRINSSGIFVDHDGAATDVSELEDRGLYDMSKVYIEYRIASIPEPEPGRYILEAESLASNGLLRGIDVELLVSHSFHK